MSETVHPSEIIRYLKAKGIRLSVQHDKLYCVEGQDNITAQLQSRIKANKEALIKYLQELDAKRSFVWKVKVKECAPFLMIDGERTGYDQIHKQMIGKFGQDRLEWVKRENISY